MWWFLLACDDFHVCDEPVATDTLPARLSETGLYADIAARQVADDALPYTPRNALWSDGADKQRWLRLPAGSVIDTTDADDWRFPVGATFWKEFALDGVVLETRVLTRTGAGDADWAAVAYVWEGDDAIATPEGATDVAGTAHDVPDAASCFGCHGGRKSRVLGVSAVQLPEVGVDGVGLEDLRGTWLDASVEAVDPPGDTTAQAALGYLHANCSHCHNQIRPDRVGARCYDPENDLDFHLPGTAVASVDDTPAIQSAVDHGIKRGDADASEIIHRMSARGDLFGAGMPPLGTEVVDDEGIAALRAWIDTL